MFLRIPSVCVGGILERISELPQGLRVCGDSQLLRLPKPLLPVIHLSTSCPESSSPIAEALSFPSPVASQCGTQAQTLRWGYATRQWTLSWLSKENQMEKTHSYSIIYAKCLPCLRISPLLGNQPHCDHGQQVKPQGLPWSAPSLPQNTWNQTMQSLADSSPGKSNGAFKVKRWNPELSFCKHGDTWASKRETSFVLRVQRAPGHSKWMEKGQEGWDGREAKQGSSFSLVTGIAVCWYCDFRLVIPFLCL